jgi:hypothetical protein
MTSPYYYMNQSSENIKFAIKDQPHHTQRKSYGKERRYITPKIELESNSYNNNDNYICPPNKRFKAMVDLILVENTDATKWAIIDGLMGKREVCMNNHQKFEFHDLYIDKLFSRSKISLRFTVYIEVYGDDASCIEQVLFHQTIYSTTFSVVSTKIYNPSIKDISITPSTALCCSGHGQQYITVNGINGKMCEQLNARISIGDMETEIVSKSQDGIVCSLKRRCTEHCNSATFYDSVYLRVNNKGLSEAKRKKFESIDKRINARNQHSDNMYSMGEDNVYEIAHFKWTSSNE